MASRDPSRPNLLVILTDDQGAWALGCAGNDEIRTPHLARLAATGIHGQHGRAGADSGGWDVFAQGWTYGHPEGKPRSAFPVFDD